MELLMHKSHYQRSAAQCMPGLVSSHTFHAKVWKAFLLLFLSRFLFQRSTYRFLKNCYISCSNFQNLNSHTKQTNKQTKCN